MKIAVLLPDPRIAHGLAELLHALDHEEGISLRAVALGQATAATLPDGLDVMVYPVREGTRLPGPFLAALLEHLGTDAMVAPLGAVDAAPVPTLLVDLGGPDGTGDEMPLPEAPAHQAWTEVVTARPERRRELVRAGLFAVHLLPEWFRAPGEPAAAAAAPLARKLRELTLLGTGAAVEPEEAPTAPASRPDAEEEVTVKVTTPLPELQATRPAPPVETEAPAAASALEGAPEQPAAHPGPETWEPEVHEPERYRERHAGREALVLASPEGLDNLSPAELAGGVVVATPASLGWLIARMGVAWYTCAAAEPTTLEAKGALAGVRTVFVHASHLEGARLAPAARALVPVLDLARAGGPSLGWSDEMGAGFFPSPGDVALAIQWAAFLGCREIRVAGTGPLAAIPAWADFASGARAILEARGCRLLMDGAGAGAGAGLVPGAPGPLGTLRAPVGG